jgi:prepilin-type processing-associated H-X9-DG protein
MEPERNIEQWLRAFAKKRRDQAGAPLDLHPATRRLLQGEVRRQFGAPEEGKPASLLQRFLKISFRPVEVLVVVALIALLASLMLPALSRSKMKSQSIGAMSNLRQIGMAARMYADDNRGRLPAAYGEMTNYLKADAATIDPVSGGEFVYLSGGQSLSNLPPGSVLAYSPTDKKARAVLFADGHVELADRERFLELTNRGRQQLALAGENERQRLAKMPATQPPAAAPVESPTPAVAAIPPTETVTVSKEILKSELDREKSKDAGVAVVSAGAPDAGNFKPGAAGAHGQVAEPAQISSAKIVGFVAMSTNSLPSTASRSQNFVRSDVITTGRSRRVGDEGASARTTPVLASFQVQQDGREIRVVDQDGSVYSGSMQPQPAILSGKSDSGGALDSPTLEPVPSRQSEEKKLPAMEPAGLNYFFRVAGTNQSLKQSVVFAGSLVMITNRASVAPAGGAGGGGGGGMQNLPAGRVEPWSPSNSRISGTAVIGLTNQIEINAVPAIP